MRRVFRDPGKIHQIIAIGDPLFDIPPSKLSKQQFHIIGTIMDCYERKEWKSMMICFDSFKYFLVFLAIYKELNDTEYFQVLGLVLNQGIYMNDYRDALEYLIGHPKRDLKYRKHMMDENERRVLKKLKTNTIYRGCNAQDRNGYSWTLDKDTATNFAKRQIEEAVLLKGNFKKADVIAFFTRENEIFINPENVYGFIEVDRFSNSDLSGNDITNRRNKNQAIRDYTKNTKPYKDLMKEVIEHRVG